MLECSTAITDTTLQNPSAVGTRRGLEEATEKERERQQALEEKTGGTTRL